KLSRKMRNYKALYDILGVDKFVETLRKDDLIRILKEMNIMCSKVTSSEMANYILNNLNKLEDALLRLDQKDEEESRKRYEEFRDKTRSQNLPPASKREKLSVELNNTLAALTDDEYEQVLNFADNLRGKRTPQFY